LNSFFTGRRLFFIALFSTSILFITLYKNQHAEVDTPVLQTTTGSPRAFPAADKLPGQVEIRLASVSIDRTKRQRVILPINDPSISPSTILAATQMATPEPTLPALPSFIAQVTNGEADTLVGIYVKGIMALHIVQQPNGDPAYIDLSDGSATQYYRASIYGTIGLLAHNYLSGRHFFEISLGTDLILVYGDGRTSQYTVSEIGDYQRLSLTDVRSDFVDLATNEQKNVDEVFAHYYQQKQVLTLQTCIAQNGKSDWGVRFILARPYYNLKNKIEVTYKSYP
jgi:hypothetical protein